MRSVQLKIEVSGQEGVRVIVQALDSYRARLRASIGRTRATLAAFEQRYGVATEALLRDYVAEDLNGGDWDYVSWAGEAALLAGLESELRVLDDALYSIA